MKKILLLFALSTAALSSGPAFAYVSDFRVYIHIGARSIAEAESSSSESAIIDSARAHARIYEENVLRDTDDTGPHPEIPRIGNNPIIISALAIDSTLSDGCTYCNSYNNEHSFSRYILHSVIGTHLDVYEDNTDESSYGKTCITYVRPGR